MPQDDEYQYEGLEQTTLKLELGDQELVITRQDALEIKRALQAYLTSSQKQLRETIPANWIHVLPEPHNSWIDDQGLVHIDTWLLEARGDHAVLTHRPHSQGGHPLGCQFVAYLEHDAGKWTVSLVGFQRGQPRR